MNAVFSTTGIISFVTFPVGGYSYEEGDGFFKRDSSSNHKLTGSKGGVFDIAIADIVEFDKDPSKCCTILASTVRHNGVHVRSVLEKDNELDEYTVFIYDCDEVVSDDITA